MSATAKLFRHGRSQAVRLPKEYRFEGNEVRVTRVGDRVILEPIPAPSAMPWADIDATGDRILPGGREQPALPANRVAFED